MPMRPRLVLAALACLAAALGAPAAAAQATTEAGTTTIPFQETYASPCTGETLVFFGTQHITTRYVTDANGRTHAQFQITYVLRAVGETTGTRY